MRNISRYALAFGGLMILVAVGTRTPHGSNPVALQADNGPIVTIGSPLPLPVQLSVPAKPFFATVSLPTFPGNSTSVITGPGSGKLAITSITATNTSNSPVGAMVSNVTTAGSCISPQSDVAPALHFIVPANGTLHLPLPSPMVVPQSATGSTCIDVITGAGLLSANALTIDIDGYVN